MATKAPHHNPRVGRSRSGHRAQRVATLALGLTVLTLAAGCSAISPITTHSAYSASDGIRLVLGENVRGENLMVISAAKGDPGRLLGAVTNDGDQDTEVSLTIDSQNVSVPVAARSTVLLGAPDIDTGAVRPDGDGNVDILFDAIQAPPGAMVELTLATGRDGAVSARIPVLDGTFPEYAPLVP